VSVQDKHRIDKLKGHLALLGRTLDVLGLPVQAPQAILQGIRERALLRANLSEDAIQSAIIERAEARKSKNFELADRLREDFLSLGITFQDSPDGTTWRPVAPKGSLP
jgi:cysteinyl-tRNA synthetase